MKELQIQLENLNTQLAIAREAYHHTDTKFLKSEIQVTRLLKILQLGYKKIEIEMNIIDEQNKDTIIGLLDLSTELALNRMGIDFTLKNGIFYV
jgi:uncharacterized protein YueI